MNIFTSSKHFQTTYNVSQMKKVLLLAGLVITLGMATMAQEKPKKETKKDTTSKPVHMKAPRKATDTTHHKKH